MENLKITIALVIAVILQLTLRNLSEPLGYIDFPLIIVVYTALLGNSVRALLFATISGIVVDAMSGGLLGANGFSKTIVVFVVSEVARRVYLDNVLLRIPVIASACLLDDVIFYGMHRLLGQDPYSPFFVTLAYTLIGTTVVGTFIFVILDSFSSDPFQRKRRDIFAPRRKTRRRNPIRLERK